MKCTICKGKTKSLHNNLYDDRYGAPGNFSINCCKKCGFCRIDPVLNKDKIGKFYQKYYPLSSLKVTDVKKSINNFPKFVNWIMGTNNITHRYIDKNSNVLDVGSASGVSLLEIKKLGGNAYGVEPDPNASRIAKALKLNVFKGFLTDGPYPNTKFDFVTASQVIEHEPDPLKFLISAKKKLKKDGKIILSFPNFGSLHSKVFGREWINWHVPYHINYFNKKSFKLLVKKAGLRILKEKTITPNIWTVLQIRKLFIKNKIGEKNILWTIKKSSWIVKMLNLALFVLITPINRIVDKSGYGDSLLIILDNNE